ncbi:Glyco-hydro-cc domain-containing protein [Mycena kentingensis (nom. inval.)]|nr:Glyco-hydro-cc domain-containing protein [Mycena kentingensis (nom. inval.)]
MTPTAFLNLISIGLLAVLSTSLPTTTAVSLHSGHVVRSHHGISGVHKRATNAKRCKPRASSTLSSSKAASTKAAATTTEKVAAQTTKAPSKPSKSVSFNNVNLRGKACLAWPNSDYNKLSPWKGSSVGLIYGWSPDKIPGADELGMTFAPMLWGWKQAEEFKAKVVEGYATVALGCNEPNEEGQSNMDAWSGIALWRQYMIPLLDKGYTLVSPAMSSRPNGKEWMETFMTNCGDDCGVSAIAIHYYGTDIEEFKTYVEYWYNKYNLPVLITEYADQDFNGGPQASLDEIWAFMVAATSWINSKDWIKAHCWFGAMVGMSNVNVLNTMMNSGGSGPNDLGHYFINN